MMIKVVAVIVTFTLSTIFFSTDRMTPLAKSAIQLGIRNDKFRFIGALACKTCNLSLKRAEAATLSCGEKMSGYESDHKVLIEGFPRQKLKFDEKDPISLWVTYLLLNT